MSSRIGHFYRNIICDEQTCVNYLKSKQLLPQNEENNLTCNKVREGVSCGGDLKDTTRTSKKRNSDGSFKRTVPLDAPKKGVKLFNQYVKVISSFIH